MWKPFKLIIVFSDYRSDNSQATEKLLKEKDQQIAELLEEGKNSHTICREKFNVVMVVLFTIVF